MDNLYENILGKLSNEEKIIVEFYNDMRLQKLRHEKDVLLQNLQHEKDAFVQNLQHEKDVLQVKYEALETIVAQANLEKMQKLNLVDVRGFVDYFDRNILDHRISVRNTRFEKFIAKNPKKLEEWGLFLETFTKMFPLFYPKLCNSAHPVFYLNNCLVINTNSLEPIEFKILGLLWESIPLPTENLLVRLDGVFDQMQKVCEIYKE